MTSDNPQSLRKRSVRIAGHQTSVSLENAFWYALRKIATEQNVSVNRLITEIDKNRVGNLSGAIRVFVLQHLDVKNND